MLGTKLPDELDAPMNLSSLKNVLENILQKFISDLHPVEYVRCEIDEHNYNLSWQIALSIRESYFVPCIVSVKFQDQKEIKFHFCNVPLMTTRGTFVIQGRERITKKTIKATDISKDKKGRRHLSESEKNRDLSHYEVWEADFYEYLYKSFVKMLDMADDKKYISIPEYFEDWKDYYLHIFNSQAGIELFPFIDATNPLSEVEHKRKYSFIRGEKTRDGRDIHPTHYGRFCVVETPESEKIGMRLHLAHKAEIANRKILTPLLNIKTNMIENVEAGQDGFTVDEKTRLDGNVLARGGNDGQYLNSSEIKHSDAFNDQLFGYAALQVPFIQHNDPARALMGAKNLKQAVPLKSPESPIVKTGYESTVAELSGRIIKAEEKGKVEISNGVVIIKSESGEKKYPFVHGTPSVMSKTAFVQTPIVKEGEDITAGQVIIEGSGIRNGELALGANFLVAYMPYDGFNIDDGIVVSEEAAKKLTSIHIEEFDIRLQEGDIPILESLVKEGCRLERLKGSMPQIAVVKRMENRKSEKISLFARGEMLGGVVQKVFFDVNKITLWIKKERHLEVGDKLMGRHGNKGIVSRIIQHDEMPYFELEINDKKERRHIDVILNPHSVIARMNLGQIYETHWGWVAREHPDEEIKKQAMMMGKPFSNVDLAVLSNWLEKSGLDQHGKITINFSDGNRTDNPVVVGYQYIVKLNHLASGKLSVRGETGPVSYVTDIPLSGKKNGGGQRIGEMEVWALMAHGANEILNDMLGLKSNAHKIADNAVSVSESLKALIYYLRGLGIAFEVFDADNKKIEPEDFSNTKRNEIAHYILRWAEDSDFTTWGRHLGKSLKAHFENQNVEFKNGPQNILNLADLTPKNKEQMGYIELAEPVTLCEREVKYLPVMPMRCRPRLDGKLNRLYNRIFLANNNIKKLKAEGKSDTEAYIKGKTSLIKHVKKVEKEISGLIKGKGGIIRKAILGKRVNFSARSVVVPDPTIPADSALIPQKIMIELGIKNPEIDKTHDGYEIKKAQKVLLSRQPTLHIHNIQAFMALPHNDNAIAINPLIRKGFNADFDGDTMAVYATDKLIPAGMHVSENIFLAANGRINLDFSQDIAAGIYYASQTKHGKTEFERLIGDKEIFDASRFATIKNKNISDLLLKFYLKCNDRIKTLRLAEKIADFGLKQATLSGLTFGIFDLNELSLTNDEKSLVEYREKDEKSIPRYHIKGVDDFLECNINNPNLLMNPISIMMLSGAKGDIKQLRQMAGIKGVVERLGGKSVSASINASYLEGLRPTEYYLACFGARKSLGDKKLMTPQCGYLTRRLAFSALDMRINKDDCGTNEGVSLDVNLSLGRTLLKGVSVNGDTILRNTVVDEKILDSFKNAGIDKIDVRSPLKCRTDKGGLCVKCYGWHLSKKKEVQTGFAVGIMSAEVIGERATQDAMRTYHKGEATATIKDFKDIESVFDNATNSSTKKRISERIHNTDDAFELANTLFNIYEKNVDIKHYEVILRTLMIGNEFKGTKGVITDKGILYNASFERAVDVFKNYAKEPKEFLPDTVLERLFK